MSALRQWLREQAADEYYFAIDRLFAQDFIINGRCLICSQPNVHPMTHFCWWRGPGASSELLRRDPRFWSTNSTVE